MGTESQAARRYAEAFIGMVGPDSPAADELAMFAEAVGGVAEFRHVLLNPSFTASEEENVLEAVMDELKLSDVVRRFVRLVAERERMGEIEDIASTVKRLSDERGNLVRAKVASAEALSDEAVTRLKAAIEKRTGKTVELDIAVDPALIGGVKTTVGSIVFDGTIRAELDRLREVLNTTE